MIPPLANKRVHERSLIEGEREPRRGEASNVRMELRPVKISGLPKHQQSIMHKDGTCAYIYREPERRQAGLLTYVL